jgi:hypothetical protein
MKTRVAALAALLFAVLLLAGWTLQTKPQQWEYETYSTHLPDEKLNLIGSRGWELIEVEVDGKDTRYFFKRAK